MGYKMSGSPHKLGTIEGTTAFKDREIKEAKKLVKENDEKSLLERI